MMRRAGSTPTFKNCAFCAKTIQNGTGMMHARNDGRILWTCSKKCDKNMFMLRRDARKLKWTERYVRGGAQVKEKVARPDYVIVKYFWQPAF